MKECRLWQGQRCSVIPCARRRCWIYRRYFDHEYWELLEMERRLEHRVQSKNTSPSPA